MTSDLPRLVGANANHGETDEGDNGSRVAIEVFSETVTAADPGEGR